LRFRRKGASAAASELENTCATPRTKTNSWPTKDGSTKDSEENPEDNGDGDVGEGEGSVDCATAKGSTSLGYTRYPLPATSTPVAAAIMLLFTVLYVNTILHKWRQRLTL
jgi:hypothetical protein